MSKIFGSYRKRVKYSSSLWGVKKGLPGFLQKVNWQFEYAGTRRCVPAIYRFSKGIVFDIITFIDNDKLLEYHKKYEEVGGNLTQMQRRCAEQENPYQDLSIKEIWINEQLVDGNYSSSSAISIPWAENNDNLLSLQKAYSYLLDETSCFACQRFCIPYPKTKLMALRLKRLLRIDRVYALKIHSHNVERFFPLEINFEMLDTEKQKEVHFVHPKTGIKHNMYIQGTEVMEIPLNEDGSQSLYGTQAMYEIKPQLPYGSRLQFKNSMEYVEPELKLDRFEPDRAAAIGIIGGADGPTSIFMNNQEKMPRGLHGLPLYSCMSVPGFQKKDISHFVLEGINVVEHDIAEINLNNKPIRLL